MIVTRKLDQRRRATPFIQESRRDISRASAQRTIHSNPLGTMTRAHARASGTQRAWRSVDSFRAGVILVTNISDLPATRRTAERILGVPVRTIHADSLGTIYAPEA